jgi:mannose-6-phosphate isomerase-like protein (cupin superfamily)
MTAVRLTLENRHTGECLEISRADRNGEKWLMLRGSLPPRRQGPPLHVHFSEIEEFHVKSGTLGAEADGRTIQVPAGGSATFKAGSSHRWWNDGDDVLIVDGYAGPVVDLDRYLQAAFEILNSSPSDRPSLFYMGHLAWRHRHTQAVLFMPRPLQAVVLPLILAVGTVLGRYRGSEWPGCPDRCRGIA